MRTTHGTTRSALNDPRPRHFYSPPLQEGATNHLQYRRTCRGCNRLVRFLGKLGEMSRSWGEAESCHEDWASRESSKSDEIGRFCLRKDHFDDPLALTTC